MFTCYSLLLVYIVLVCALYPLGKAHYKCLFIIIIVIIISSHTVFNFLTNYGIAVTFPLFIALGNLIGLPLNAGKL